MIKVYKCLACELLSYSLLLKKVKHTTNMPKLERDTIQMNCQREERTAEKHERSPCTTDCRKDQCILKLFAPSELKTPCGANGRAGRRKEHTKTCQEKCIGKNKTKRKYRNNQDGVNGLGAERVDGRDNRRSKPSRNSHLLFQDDVLLGG